MGAGDSYARPVPLEGGLGFQKRFSSGVDRSAQVRALPSLLPLQSPCPTSPPRGAGKDGSSKDADERGPRRDLRVQPSGLASPRARGTQDQTLSVHAVQVLPGERGSGLAAPGELAALLASPSPKPPSPSRGLLAMGFLDPIQTPFNYPRQTAVLVVGGNQIRVPGDSGSRGDGSPARQRGQFPFTKQPATEPVCQEQESGRGSTRGDTEEGTPGPSS